MLCPRHPKQRMEPTGRQSGNVPIRHCPICTETIRLKLAPLIGNRGFKHRTGKQVVLPPVRMPWT